MKSAIAAVLCTLAFAPRASIQAQQVQKVPVVITSDLGTEQSLHSAMR